MDLAAKINEQFLTCQLCHRLYNEPKCLNCLHTFCKKCIENELLSQKSWRYSDYKEISCPICRRKTSLPAGGANRLPDNFVLSGLREMIVDKVATSTELYCHFCRSSTTSQEKNQSAATDDLKSNERRISTRIDRNRATLKCIECQKPICEKCSLEHQSLSISSTHNFYELELENDVLCNLHPDDPVRYFCETCEQCICIICACGPEHKNHTMLNFKSAAMERRKSVVDQLETCQRKLIVVQSQLDTIDECEKRINNIQTEIVRHSAEMKKNIEMAEAKCLETLETAFGQNLKLILETKPHLEQLHEKIKNTCSLVDLMLQGREVELLLMLKPLSEKMCSIMNMDVCSIETPSDMFEHLQFIPGNVKVGEVVTSPIEAIEDQKRWYADCSTQTDECIVLDKSVSRQLVPIKTIDENILKSNTDSRSSTPQSDVFSEAGDILPRLTRKVRRILKRNCTLAVLPNSDIMVLDPETNSLSILDKKGKIKYFVFDNRNDAINSNVEKNDVLNGNNSAYVGVGGFHEISISDANDKAVSLKTPQGNLVIKLENELTDKIPIGFTVHAYNSIAAMKIVKNDVSAQEKNRREKHRFEISRPNN